MTYLPILHLKQLNLTPQPPPMNALIHDPIHPNLEEIPMRARRRPPAPRRALMKERRAGDVAFAVRGDVVAAGELVGFQEVVLRLLLLRESVQVSGRFGRSLDNVSGTEDVGRLPVRHPFP